jgi:hypothetical protein
MTDETPPPPTDYTQFSVEEIWDMVSPVDRISPAQLVAWGTMADLCRDQADVLGRALAQLAEHWVPTPGSAAQAFQKYANKLVQYLAAGHGDANKMFTCLDEIIMTMDRAIERMEPIIYAYRHYAAVEESWRQAGLGGLYTGNPNAPVPIHEDVPANWQATLHAQATQVMIDTDAAMATITAAMPFIEKVSLDLPPKEDAKPVDGGPGTTPWSPPQLPTLAPADAPRPLSVAAPQSPAPVLAGRGVDLPSPVGSGQGLLNRLPSDLPDVVQPTVLQTGVGLPPAVLGRLPNTEPVAQVGDIRAGSSGSRPSGAAVDPETVQRGSAATPLVAAPAGVRSSQQPTRTGTRPGGRAALWSSQRRRKDSDPTDPWRVPRGGPAVIEAPEEPSHDPGPGVIG